MREGAEGTLFLDTAEDVILLQSVQALLPAAVQQRQIRAAKLLIWRGWIAGRRKLRGFCRRTPAAVTLADAHAALLRGETLSPAVLLPGENGGIILAG